ncbi:MAG: CRISPR-associated endonuclease Cas2 [Desulfatiglandaceae bacterium]
MILSSGENSISGEMAKIVKKQDMIKTGMDALDLIGKPGEVLVYVFYDIQDDRVRIRAARVCKDYGLERIQFSGFVGYLSRNRREELGVKIRDIISGSNGKVLIQPVCEKDFREFREYMHFEEEIKGSEKKKVAGKKKKG